MALEHGHHKGQSQGAGRLVANPAKLTVAVVASAFLHGHISRYILVCQGSKTHGTRFLGLDTLQGFVASQAFMSQACVVHAFVVHAFVIHAGMHCRCERRIFCHGHPRTGPHAQRHEAKQEANEDSAHGAILNQARTIKP
jgi:hypothetical protein